MDPQAPAENPKNGRALANALISSAVLQMRITSRASAQALELPLPKDSQDLTTAQREKKSCILVDTSAPIHENPGSEKGHIFCRLWCDIQVERSGLSYHASSLHMPVQRTLPIRGPEAAGLGLAWGCREWWLEWFVPGRSRAAADVG